MLGGRFFWVRRQVFPPSARDFPCFTARISLETHSERIFGHFPAHIPPDNHSRRISPQNPAQNLNSTKNERENLHFPALKIPLLTSQIVSYPTKRILSPSTPSILLSICLSLMIYIFINLIQIRLLAIRNK